MLTMSLNKSIEYKIGIYINDKSNIYTYKISPNVYKQVIKTRRLFSKTERYRRVVSHFILLCLFNFYNHYVSFLVSY